jgi:predicted metalloprotease
MMDNLAMTVMLIMVVFFATMLLVASKAMLTEDSASTAPDRQNSASPLINQSTASTATQDLSNETRKDEPDIWTSGLSDTTIEYEGALETTDNAVSVGPFIF